jgi:transcriptional regulator with XRE-family HTH domain
MRNLVCAQAGQNLLLMKSIGDQVRAYRLSKSWTTAQMAEAVGGKNGKVKRQHIEQLEKAGNRKPQYIGDLAQAMGLSVDDLLIEAGLLKRRPRAVGAPPSGPLSERLKAELQEDPYELIERGLNALVVVGAAKEDILKAVHKYAEIAAETQRALEERFRRQEANSGGSS